MKITISEEDARGCGYRHSGPGGVGLYLMGNGIFDICERLPFPVGVCPCCGEGTKFSQGFTWITPAKLFASNRVPRCFLKSDQAGVVAEASVIRHNHATCFMCTPPDYKHGLMWVGEKFYSTGSFLQEAVTRGISKRISSLPRGFVLGDTVVYLAHKKGYGLPGGQYDTPAVFTVFKPSHLDIVVDTDDPGKLPNRAVQLANKFGDAVRIIKVEPVYEQKALF